ncbi:MAG: MFS transporter [Solirubrobacterales bacterium]
MTVDIHKLQNRTLSVLVGAQLFTGAGISAGIVVGALLAEDIFGSTSAAGVPATVFTIGSALAALTVGMISQRRGRRVGLAAGYIVSALGAAGVVAAAEFDSIPLFIASLFFYGAAFSTNLQARYAGADLARPEARATAVSIVLVATTVGAVIAPNLTELTGDLLGQGSFTPQRVGAGRSTATGGAVLAVGDRAGDCIAAADRAAPARPAVDGARARSRCATGRRPGW